VNTLEVSPHQPGRVILAVQRYRMNDFAPYVYVTNDFGESWQLLTDGANGIPADHPVRVVREDPDRLGLLYAGTEFGMFVSFDEGEHWQSLQLNLPVTPITDLQAYRGDLVVATQGRSFWILDDVSPLHQLDAAIAAADVHLYQPAEAQRVRRGGRGGSRSAGGPPSGAVFRYYLRESAETELTLDVLAADGSVIRSFSSDSTKNEDEPTLDVESGMNQFVWDLRHPGLDLPEGAMAYLGYVGGATAVPGEYQVRLTLGDWSQTHSFQLLGDPRLPDVTPAELQEQYDLSVRVRATLGEAYDAMNSLRAVRQQVKDIAKRAQDADYGEDLVELADSIADMLTAVEDELINTKSESRQDPINFPPQLDNQLGYLYRYVVSAYGRPTQAAYDRLADLEQQLAQHRAELRRVLDEDVARFNAILRERDVPAVIIPEDS
jgi:hypothetical protein